VVGPALGGEAVFLVALAGLDGLDGAVEGKGDEQGPGEVA
jgi:hypothetical protein